MIISRGLNLLRIAHKSNQRKIAIPNLRFVRLSHGGAYREFSSPKKTWLYAAEAIGAFTWWWILWHFWHDFDLVAGEVTYPDPSQWTDEELGVPPDDYPEPAIRV